MVRGEVRARLDPFFRKASKTDVMKLKKGKKPVYFSLYHHCDLPKRFLRDCKGIHGIHPRSIPASLQHGLEGEIAGDQ